MSPYLSGLQERENAISTISSASAKNGPNLRVPEHIHKVLSSILIRPSQKTRTSMDVFAQQRLEPHFTDHFQPGLQLFLVHWTSGSHHTHNITFF
jgi:hypothetical protein